MNTKHQPPTTITVDPGASRHPYATARVAGLLYVIIVVFGLFAEVGVRARLVEAGDPATTASNIMESAWLFRAGFAADLVVFLADVALAVVLYELLKPLSRILSMAAAAFRLTQTAIIGMNLLNMFNAVRILDDAEYLDSFGAEGVEALALLTLDTHKYGYILGLTFFGVATMIIGYVATTSRRMPTALGLVLGLAGAGYVIDSAMFFMIPGYDGSASPIVLAPAVISEAWFALWLLTRAHRLADSGATPDSPAAVPSTARRISVPA
ncbi:MAG: DUF4386 domain-containing protein [Acidimicrobiales bacterium]|nr:DUF4386 domain-containing protein [Acidimicrobiales bacterium]